jgi:hypothetical protein
MRRKAAALAGARRAHASRMVKVARRMISSIAAQKAYLALSTSSGAAFCFLTLRPNDEAVSGFMKFFRLIATHRAPRFKQAKRSDRPANHDLMLNSS